MADAHTRIDTLKEDIREIGYSILDLQTKAQAHDAKLEQVIAKLGAHEARFDAYDRRFDQLDARFDAYDRRFDQLDARFDAYGRRFDHLDAQLAEILTRLPQRPE